MCSSINFLGQFKDNIHHTIHFTDEKIFSIEEVYNAQNNCVYAHSSKVACTKFPRVQRSHHPQSVMVWWGIHYGSVTSNHFCEKGVKTSGAVYCCMQDEVVKPLNETLFEFDD